MPKKTPKELLHEIRTAVDQLDDLVDAAQSVLPGPVKILVPLVDAIRKTIDLIDGLVK